MSVGTGPPPFDDVLTPTRNRGCNVYATGLRDRDRLGVWSPTQRDTTSLDKTVMRKGIACDSSIHVLEVAGLPATFTTGAVR